MDIEEIFDLNGWSIAGHLSIPPRESKTFKVVDLPLTDACQRFLSVPPYSGNIYQHQKQTIQESIEGNHVCIATGTASGKSLAFQVAAIQELSLNPSSRVIAIYPMKALGNEQTERWRHAIEIADIDAKVGRIDGSVKGRGRRLDILANSRVLIFTPDIIHAWLLSNVANKVVQNFLGSAALIVVDEVHTYTGVFGSNSAFLFRRLRHLMQLLGRQPKFICASATISEPQKHLQKLFGLDFKLIDQAQDTSPKHQLNIQLVNPPAGSNFLTNTTQLLTHVTNATNHRFITFVDSRVQVEHISSILAREATSSENDPEQDVDDTGRLISSLQVLPYRAGYESKDRNKIQRRLSQEDLRGVISTSALELGIDIPGLDLCILVGVPNSQTSLHQRIGRIGRHGKGHVIIINSGDVFDQAVFANPEELLKRPPIESALYLENKYIQYIHVLCLARLDGEHDQVAANLNLSSANQFNSPVVWPDGFLTLATRERIGEIPKEFQSMKAESSDNPNYTFPLRDVESQFSIEYKKGLDSEQLGSLSYSQLMREAYPGSVYYHLTRAFRVYQVLTRSKIVRVRQEKKYTTKPQKMPVQVFPNLTSENTFVSYKLKDLVVVECDLQVRESVSGFKERRGPNENSYSYPIPPVNDIIFDLPYFTRNYFTTGVIITHPALNQESVNCIALAELIFEAFLMLIPFDRQDISFAVDKHRSGRKPLIKEQDKFIAIYDQTYGSLRLSGRFIESTNLEVVLEKARALAEGQETIVLNTETLQALNSLAASAKDSRSELLNFGSENLEDHKNNSLVRIILPGSKGLNLNYNNEVFQIGRIFHTPTGLRYAGPSHNDPTAEVTPLIDSIIEIPGESQIGYYNLETGEVVELKSTIHVEAKTTVEESAKVISKTSSQAKEVDINKLKLVLTRYFNKRHLTQLAKYLGIDKSVLESLNDKADVIKTLVDYCDQTNQSMQLLKATRTLYEKLYGNSQS